MADYRVSQLFLQSTLHPGDPLLRDVLCQHVVLPLSPCLFRCTWGKHREQDHHSKPLRWVTLLLIQAELIPGYELNHWKASRACLGIQQPVSLISLNEKPVQGFIKATESFIMINIKQYSVWNLCTILPYKKQLMSSDPWYMKQFRFITSWRIVLWQQRIPFVPDLMFPKTSFSPPLILSLGADPLVLGR